MVSLARLLLLMQLMGMPLATSSEGLIRGGGGDRVLWGDNAAPASSNSTGVEHHRASHMGGMEPRIVGGSRAPNGRNPYTVALVDDIGLFCGGVLICDDMVLTAAHCGDQKTYFEVLVGSERLSDRFGSGKGETIFPKRGWIHPDFSWSTMDNDFMIFQLERAVTADVDPVIVNDDPGEPARSGEDLVALGWGDTNPSSLMYTGSNDLMKVTVDYIPNNDCQGRTGYIGADLVSYRNLIRKSMLCSLAPGRDGCQGDSGGPLIIEGNDSKGRQDVLVGLSSWGYACAHQTLPGVYARVSSDYNWIKRIVCDNSGDQAQRRVFGCGGGGSNMSPINKPPKNKPNNKPPKNKPSNKPPIIKPSNKPPSKTPDKKPDKKPNKKPSPPKRKKKKKKKKNKKNVYILGGKRQRRRPRHDLFKHEAS